MSIRPENYTLGKLLQNRLFRIPDYQRTYSWETKQRKDLFEDIQKLAENTNSDRHHFMSTVVCLQIPKREEVGADEFGIFYVVDGQQRLTTLIILLKALIKELNAGNETDKREANKLQELLVKENGRLILLQTNHDNKSLFRNYLEKGKFPDEKNVETLADSNMIRAFQECEEFVREWHLNNLSILELLKLVKNRLDFIFYVLQDEGAVHTTFEVLNSRGLAVDWLDKCKSMLMGIAYEKLDSNTSEECIGELHTCWSQIYRTIGIKQVPGQEILRFTATLEESGKSKVVGAEYAMEFFRSKCELNPKLVIEVSNKLLEITEQLESLIKNPRLKAVTKISHARLLAVAIMLNKHLNIDDKKKILEEWEKITFRIFGMSRRDARTKVGEYVCLAREIFNNQDWSVDQIIEKIQHIGKDYPASEAVKQLENTNCYEGWQEELVYLFFRYEEYLNRQLNGSI
ncbi:MAG: DUF262 domain-containing protein, partial [Oscillatoria sp. PMC 1076.18]|nr:DUF262 domain-containing protein [Oscillatoria sp. PMC 1076.18]